MTTQIRLDDLIEAIKKVHDNALDQLADAVIAADHLGELADHLIGHFVDQARRSGASWTEIGRSMGVTRQAAQKRFVPKDVSADLDPAEGFNRFTPRARKALMAGHEAAKAAGNDQVVPAHIVLGLLDDPGALAGVTITELGVRLDAVREAAEAALPEPAAEVPSLVPYDAAAKKALELTFREALRLGHNYIGTEHMLLALLEQEDGAGVLAGVGLEKAAVEARVVETLKAITAFPKKD
ncbi:Clp protease N-terminal domain-containing protein [Streptomyces radicis]|uniref:ATP-dependent Clp protease ATP-binding subunit n=1 Tax=Streptomyces radicis TaxID=1750517 RepID=A0A3A9W0F4_9ACTN|nr:Clp protease N-terminal domain-containing protein [Streptomyces radicis]RKN06450.1 ATP-dependent Clp protease ATP-binding subunit [Streptomyces radicis]RKN20291.1 ATP-dependent Clp protease ATP-binding subunit [Streptomyces radicis]